MKNLENKILKKVYLFETKKTILEIVSRTVLILLVGFFGFIFTSLLVEILNEQGSFDLLDIFSDDWSMVKKYFFDNLSIFFQETPKLILFLSGVFIVITIILIILLFKNFKIIKNKIRSIINYFSHL